MSDNVFETWWEGKAFRRWKMYDPAKEPGEVSEEFRGPNAEAEARAWFAARVGIPEFDAVYVYCHEPQGPGVVERTLILSHADTYPYVGDDEDDDYDYWDGDDDDESFWEDELDEIDEVSYDAADGTEGSR